MVITSRSNEHIKRSRALTQAKEREKTGLHLIEGEKLLLEAVESGLEIVDVFVEEGYAVSRPYDACVHVVSRSVLESLSEVSTPQGVVATVATPKTEPPASYPEGLIVALDRLQDPGNVGTIIRTADAMGAAGVLLSPDAAAPFSGKAVRAAMGSTYHLPVWIAALEPELDRLIAQGALCLAGDLAGSETLPEIGKRCVLVIGNEGSGVSKPVAARCVRYRLPMRGKAESLNASVAAGILMYVLSKQFA